MSRGHRSTEIHQRQVRARKLGLLRKLYQESTSEKDHTSILEKVSKIAPWVTKEIFLSPLAKKEVTA